MLLPHQYEAVQELLKRGGGLLADDPGLGKTRAALAWAKCMRKMERGRDVLIICPATLISGWEKECAEMNIQPCIFHGSKKNITSSWTITSYQTFIQNFDIFREYSPGLLILDEAHALKSPTSQLSRALSEFPTVARLALTGTPIPNKIEDGWGIIHFVNPQIAGTYQDWLDRYCIVKTKQIYVKGRTRYINVITGYKNLDHLYALLNAVQIRRTKEDVLKLPEKEISLIPYQHDEADYLDTLDMIALNESGVLEKIIRLQASLSGLEPWERQIFKRGPKYQKLLEVLNKTPGHVVIWFQSRETLEWVQAYLLRDQYREVYTYSGQNTAQRCGNIEAWKQRGGLLLATTASAATGHNWTEAAEAVFYEPPISPAVNRQAQDRIHRIGQTKPVRIRYLYAPGTLEQAILLYLSKKQDIINSVLEETTPAELAEIYKTTLSLRI